MASINIGVIGYGYWGPNIVRNFFLNEDCVVRVIADSRLERLAIAKKMFPVVHCTLHPEDIFNDPLIDGVIIATPVSTHFDLARQALEKGKHVLIEKPMTATVSEAQQLMEVASKRGLCIMVDHTFLYTGAVKKMKELIDKGSIGQPRYFDSSRINLGLFQFDINVLWDLAAHDISILLFLINEIPESVNATGISHTQNGVENIAYMTINYRSNFIAHINSSWTSPVKVRQTLIGGDKKMILYNDIEPSEKVRVYDTGYEYKTDADKQKILIDYRAGDIYIPQISAEEALAGVAGDFVEAIRINKEPVSNANLGLEVVRILEASQSSIKAKGKEVKVSR